jgi:hypothetical protein
MLRYSQPIALPRSVSIHFWPVVAPRTGGFSYDFAILCRDEVVVAIRKAVNSGTVEYHIGSRGLKRFSLKELQDLLAFWTNAANDAALGYSSAIQTRRAAPCDV